MISSQFQKLATYHFKGVKRMEKILTYLNSADFALLGQRITEAFTICSDHIFFLIEFLYIVGFTTWLWKNNKD